MWVLLPVHELTFSRAVVGPVPFGCDNPVPAKLLKINGQCVAAAACLLRFFIAVETRVTAGSFGAVENLHLNERLLEKIND